MRCGYITVACILATVLVLVAATNNNGVLKQVILKIAQHADKLNNTKNSTTNIPRNSTKPHKQSKKPKQIKPTPKKLKSDKPDAVGKYKKPKPSKKPSKKSSHRPKKSQKLVSEASTIPIYVMMPLDMVNNNGDLVNPTKLGNDLKKLKSVGTDGVMVDIWWGIVEKQPQVYTWNPYKQFMQLCKEIGLQVQVVLSFHQCGTNVGDACYITLPQWVLNSCDGDCFYTDREGYRDKEYLSLGVDTQNIFPTRNGGKRTAVDMYSDLMRDFASQFSSFMGSFITTIDVGLGPAGELRYPSYQLQNGRWVFPGVGEFQNYDRYMMANLSASARAIGHPEWGLAGPDDAGTYKSYPPYNIPFYRDDGHWNQDYGRFFLTWYSDQLLQHGRSILSRARSIFGDMKIAAKIAGIHWWYMTNSHAAELTAGYYNTINRDGYDIIAQMFAENSIMFQFTCLEMFNDDSCKCGAQNLVAETRDSAWKMGIMYAGENALPIDGNQNGYNQIVRQSKVNGRKIDAFTYLRLGPNLVDNQNNLNMFQRFVQTMHSL